MSGVATVVYNLMLIMAKLALISVSVIAFVTLLTVIVSAIFIGLNIGILNDIVALIQMWLPFDIAAIIAWIITVAFMYIAYRLSILSITYLNAWLNR